MDWNFKDRNKRQDEQFLNRKSGSQSIHSVKNKVYLTTSWIRISNFNNDDFSENFIIFTLLCMKCLHVTRVVLEVQCNLVCDTCVPSVTFQIMEHLAQCYLNANVVHFHHFSLCPHISQKICWNSSYNISIIFKTMNENLRSVWCERHPVFLLNKWIVTLVSYKKIFV